MAYSVLFSRYEDAPKFAPVAMVAMIAGAALSAYGQIQQGNAAKKVAEANAQLAIQEGDSRREAHKYEGLKLSREKNAMISEQKALYGASGVDISSGTPLDVMAKTAVEYERDIGMTGLAGDKAMLKAENEAEIYKYSGKQAQKAGWLGAGSTLLSSIGKAYSMGGGK